MSVADRLVLITAAGVEIPLDGTEGVDARRGAQGAELPPISITSYPRLIGAGDLVSNVRREPRQLTQPLLIEPDDGDVRYVLRQMAGWFGTGPCILRWEDDYGFYRQLEQVYYQSGLEGDEGSSTTGVDGSWRIANVELLALDPYWYGPETSITLPVTMRTASNAAIPSSGRIPSDGRDPIVGWTITGDAAADGYVELTGPITRYTLATQKQQWTLNRSRTVAAGQKVLVDSRPESYGSRLEGAIQPDWKWLTRFSVPFTMPRSGLIAGALSGGGAAARFVYRPRWLTP